MKKSERIQSRLEIDRIYAEKLKDWPVPYEILRIPTRYGETQVIASGSSDSPLLLCFHAMGFNSLTYSLNVEALSQYFRVSSVDTIGDQGKSIVRRDYPENIQEYADWVADIVSGSGYEKGQYYGLFHGGVDCPWYSFISSGNRQ